MEPCFLSPPQQTPNVHISSGHSARFLRQWVWAGYGLWFAGIVMWAHGMIMNSFQGGTSQHAIMLGTKVIVPASGFLCSLRECHSRWWFNSSSRRRPPVSMVVSVWTFTLGEAAYNWEENCSVNRGVCRRSSGNWSLWFLGMPRKPVIWRPCEVYHGRTTGEWGCTPTAMQHQSPACQILTEKG